MESLALFVNLGTLVLGRGGSYTQEGLELTQGVARAELKKS